MITMKQVNKELAKHNFELVKSKDYYGVVYFYYAALNDDAVSIEETSVYDCWKLNDWTVKQWEEELVERIDAVDTDPRLKQYPSWLKSKTIKVKVT
tara:strand:+ start:237 stop:524 length:288 start_codon:yes stop_codon:yes gene_type:complete